MLGFVVDGKWTYYSSVWGIGFGLFFHTDITIHSPHIARLPSAITTFFFDDYPMMTTEAGSDVLKSAASTVFGAAWLVACQGRQKKRKQGRQSA